MPTVAQAEKVARVDIRGLDEAMTENVRVNLSLEDSLDKTVTQRRLDYLLDVAKDEAREALEPFGYYSPTITVQAPHWAVSQPTWVPVSCRVSRSSCTSKVFSGTSAATGRPFTVSSIFIAGVSLWFSGWFDYDLIV